MHEDVKIVARTARVLANETRFVGLVDGELHIRRLVVELATDVDIGSSSAHGTSSDETTLDELVRIVTHDLAVFARAWLALVRVYHQILGSTVRRLVHEAPLETRRKAGTAASSQARRLHLVDYPIRAFQQDLFRLVPVALRIFVFIFSLLLIDSLF